MIADAKKISSDLDSTKREHVAYIARIERDASCPKDKFYKIKSEHEAILRELNDPRNEIKI